MREVIYWMLAHKEKTHSYTWRLFYDSLTIVPGIVRIFGTARPDTSDNQYEYLVRTVPDTRTGCTGYLNGMHGIFGRLVGDILHGVGSGVGYSVGNSRITP